MSWVYGYLRSMVWDGWMGGGWGKRGVWSYERVGWVNKCIWTYFAFWRSLSLSLSGRPAIGSDQCHQTG